MINPKYAYTLPGDKMTIRKYSILIISLFLISISLFSKVKAIHNDLPLFGKVIFVDPGHGGRDPGTSYGKIEEKDIVLEISKELREQLMKQGAIVYMTRESNEDLSSKWDERKKRGDLYRRILMYKKYQADLYLSIHINYYSDTTEYGAEVLYNSINPQNKIFGTILMNNFKTSLGSKRKLKKTDLYMYRNTTVPGVLIECGFLSNPNERYLMQKSSYQKKLSKIITDSVITYFQN